MSVAIVTGSSGLVGSETVRYFAQQGLEVAGIDNDMRRRFFGDEASVDWNRRRLEAEIRGFRHHELDIRDADAVEKLFAEWGNAIEVIVHCAAQPSHDWAAREPLTDFTVNANATLVLLEAARRHCPEAVFIYMSTNKVYGDVVNDLPLVEGDTRWELPDEHPLHAGVDESMRIDQTRHSLFGVSKAAGDLLAQEYARYFGMRTGVFRGGCITGAAHSGTCLHGFLAYLMRCTVTGHPYTVFGYKAKQVRDNIHARDLASQFWHFFLNPRAGEVYNAGGGRHSNCSMLEAIALCERVAGRKLDWRYHDESRSGDHRWWISDVGKFRAHYPEWGYEYGLADIVEELGAAMRCGR